MPTLIFEDQFTTGGTWDTSNGTPVITSSPAPPDGGNSLECNAIGDYVFWNIPNSGFTRCVFGVWVYVVAAPVTDTRCFKIDSGPSEGWFNLHASAGNVEPFISANGTPSISSVFWGGANAFATATWTWCQIMFDVSANPWQLQGRTPQATNSNTGAAAASNLDPGNFLLGNTTGGSAYTVYFGHPKAGVAADDNDWWFAPSGGLAWISA